MSWPGIPRAAACVSQLMLRTLTVSERQRGTEREAVAEKVERTCLMCAKAQGESWARATPARSAGLCTPITESPRPSEKSWCSLWQTDLRQQQQTERGYGEGKHGGAGSVGGGGGNGEKDISFIDLRLVHKTEDPSFAPLWVTQSKKNGPSYGERGRDREGGREQTGSKCTPKQISKCGAQWPQRGDQPHRVGGVLYHPHLFTAVCTAALVKLKWVFPPWEAEHDMR